jgi:hypothetical protein
VITCLENYYKIMINLDLKVSISWRLITCFPNQSIRDQLDQETPKLYSNFHVHIHYIYPYISRQKQRNESTRKMSQTTTTCIFIHFSKITINTQKAQELIGFHVHLKSIWTLNQEKDHNRIQEINAYIFRFLEMKI